MKTPGVYLGLGSNLGDRQANLERALDWLGGHPQIEIIRHTPFIETEPWGMTEQPFFLNGIAEVETTLSPIELLAVAKKGEAALGRNFQTKRWAPRVIDIDILIFSTFTIDLPNLTIPHPQLIHRSFVLKQLIELDKNLFHPVFGRPLASYLGK